MLIVQTVEELRQETRRLRREARRIGFVPTMGSLHDGHLSLILESASRCDATVASVFVNPTQFGPTEDLAAYPRDLDRDARICRDGGVDVLFAPSVEEMYPEGATCFVDPGPVAEPLCGAVRPGHFRGVATVVTKLLNMVQPDVAFFGRKDLQQCAVIRRLVRDLDMPVEVAVVPTVREPDGLAMSSRNAYLSPEERRRAACLYRGLAAAAAAYGRGERRPEALVAAAARQMTEVDRLQYLELRDAWTLEPVTGFVEAPAALCVAAFVGRTRLIDNVVLGEREAEAGWRYSLSA